MASSVPVSNARRLALAAVLLLAGCLSIASDPEGARNLAAQWHQAFAEDRLDDALALYEPGFFSQHAPDQWKSALASLKKRYGRVVKVEPTFMQKDSRFRGDFYIMGYRIRMERAALTETLTVLKPINEDRMVISGQIIDTPAGRL